MDLSVLEEATGPKKLDIGCGQNPAGAEWIGVDVLPYPQVQIVGDAREVLAAIETGSIDAVHSSHFLEHLDDLEGMLREMVRVLKPGGELTAHVPHWSNPWYWSDPTHKRTFGLYTFDYFADSDLFVRPSPDYGYGLQLRLLDVQLKFRIDLGYGLRTKAMVWLQRAVNRSRRSQEFYEVNVAPLIGCYELQVRMLRIPGGDEIELTEG